MRLFALALLAACGQPVGAPKFRAAGNASPRDGGTLHIATVNNIISLDPAIQYDEVSAIAVHAMHDTLVGYKPTGALAPHLAERWEISADGLTYRFTLREGLAYADGTPIVAADFAYSLARVREMPDSPFGTFITAVTAVRTPSSRELEITLTNRDAAFLYVMAMPFTTPQRKGERPTSGPFRLVSWNEGERVELAKNPRYWDAANVHLDRIEWLENIPRETQFLMFERGDLDTIDKVSTPDYLWLVEQPAWRPLIRRANTLTTYGSRMNVRKKPFDDRRVRQALNYALDKSHSLKLLSGNATASHGILPPGLPGRDDALAPYPHDPAKARALLAEAGYPNGLDLDYVIINDEFAQKLSASMQHDFAQVGVRLHLQTMSVGSWQASITKPDGAPFSMIAWIGDYPEPSTFMDAKFHSRAIADEASANEAFYSNPALDRILDAARAELDDIKRAALHRQAERILYDDAPWVWEIHPMATEVLQPYVKGYDPHPVWLRDFTHAWLDLGPNGERLR